VPTTLTDPHPPTPALTAHHLVLLGRAPDLARLDTAALATTEPLTLHTLGPLAALTVLSPVDDYTGSQGEHNLADLAWLAPRLAHHDSIVSTARAAGPVLPARFGTLFSSAHALFDRLTLHAQSIDSALAAITGRDEWSLRLTVDRPRALEALVGLTPHSTSGAAYLRARKLHTESAQRLGPWIREQAAAILATLPPVHSAITRAPTPARTDPTDPAPEIAAERTLLADPAQAQQLTAWITNLEPELTQGPFRLQLRGPWAPYSFCPNLAPLPDVETKPWP
jgi:hypothetical protein